MNRSAYICNALFHHSRDFYQFDDQNEVSHLCNQTLPRQGSIMIKTFVSCFDEFQVRVEQL